jgi:hypothetical protein
LKKQNAIWAFVVVGAFILFYWANGRFSPKEAGVKELYSAVTNAVSEKLKAPATARFVPLKEMEVKLDDRGNALARGWVDAQNSFGALIRTHFSIEAENQGSRWHVRDINFKYLEEGERLGFNAVKLK